MYSALQNWSENRPDDDTASKVDNDVTPEDVTSSLTTIEEQPELGYNSGIWPKHFHRWSRLTQNGRSIHHPIP